MSIVMEQLNNTPVLAGVAGVVLVTAAVMMCSKGGGVEDDIKPIGQKKDSKKTKGKPSAVNEPSSALENKKPKKKDKKAAALAAPSPSPAPAPAPAPAAESTPAATAKKPTQSKKQKKKGGGNGGVEKAAAPKVSTIATVEEPSVEEKQVAKPKVRASPPAGDGWTAVETSKKDKKREKAAAAAEEEAKAKELAEAQAIAVAVAAAAAVSSSPAVGSLSPDIAAASELKPQLPSATMLVDPKKLGVLIGPKGATLKRIEEVSGCRVQLPERGEQDEPVPSAALSKSIAVDIAGPDPAAVALAQKLVLEMCSKGYSAGLCEAPGDFVEQAVLVPPRSLPDLVGSGGNVVKALRDACKVHVNLPGNKKGGGGGGGGGHCDGNADGGGGSGSDWPSEKPVKVTIAGPKDGVAKAVNAVNDIVNMYYSTVTHPGMVHAEFKVEEWQIARFCGKGGSNVRHIQGDSRARVYVPRGWASNKNVVVVGFPAQVDVAKKHVTRILQDIADMANRVSSEEGMAAAYRASKSEGGHFEQGEQEEPIEDWMREYMYKR